MLLTEVNLFGVYVSPYALILLLAWALMAALRIVLIRSGLLQHAWHPALLMVSAFIGIFSMATLLTMGGP